MRAQLYMETSAGPAGEGSVRSLFGAGRLGFKINFVLLVHPA